MPDITFAIQVHTQKKTKGNTKFRTSNLLCPACGTTRFNSAYVSDKQLYFICDECGRSNAAAAIIGVSTPISITHE